MKNIPIQNPIKPVKEAKAATIINAKISIGCFKIMLALDFMASMAFKFPKIINGTVKKVNNVIANENSIPIIGIPVLFTRVEIPELVKAIRKVATTIFKKYGAL